MYKEKLIDPEFGVKDSNQVNQDLNANKIGMFYGKMYSPFNFMNTASKEPKIQWQSYPLPSVDSTPAFTQQDFPIQYYYIVRKGYEHPEAAIKLLNLQQEVSSAGTDSEIHTRLYPQLLDKDPEIQSAQLITAPIETGGPALGNLNQYLHINGAIEQKDESLLTNDEERKNYKQVVAYMTSKDPAGYGTWAIVGPTSPFKILNDYYNDKQYVVNGFYGAATPTMTRNKGTLDKVILEEYTKIIVGNASVDQFDKLVENWNNLGGKQITKEVREWESSR
jgi:putative aldouronate transport system substrate-binding protein